MCVPFFKCTMRRKSRDVLLTDSCFLRWTELWFSWRSSDPNRKKLQRKIIESPVGAPARSSNPPPSHHVTPPPAAQRGRRGSAHTRLHAASLLLRHTAPFLFKRCPRAWWVPAPLHSFTRCLPRVCGFSACGCGARLLLHAPPGSLRRAPFPLFCWGCVSSTFPVVIWIFCWSFFWFGFGGFSAAEVRHFWFSPARILRNFERVCFCPCFCLISPLNSKTSSGLFVLGRFWICSKSKAVWSFLMLQKSDLHLQECWCFVKMWCWQTCPLMERKDSKCLI